MIYPGEKGYKEARAQALRVAYGQGRTRAEVGGVSLQKGGQPVTEYEAVTSGQTEAAIKQSTPKVIELTSAQKEAMKLGLGPIKAEVAEKLVAEKKMQIQRKEEVKSIVSIPSGRYEAPTMQTMTNLAPKFTANIIAGTPYGELKSATQPSPLQKLEYEYTATSFEKEPFKKITSGIVFETIAVPLVNVGTAVRHPIKTILSPIELAISSEARTELISEFVKHPIGTAETFFIFGKMGKVGTKLVLKPIIKNLPKKAVITRATGIEYAFTIEEEGINIIRGITQKINIETSLFKGKNLPKPQKTFNIKGIIQETKRTSTPLEPSGINVYKSQFEAEIIGKELEAGVAKPKLTSFKLLSEEQRPYPFELQNIELKGMPKTEIKDFINVKGYSYSKRVPKFELISKVSEMPRITKGRVKFVSPEQLLRMGKRPSIGGSYNPKQYLSYVRIKGFGFLDFFSEQIILKYKSKPVSLFGVKIFKPSKIVVKKGFESDMNLMHEQLHREFYESGLLRNLPKEKELLIKKELEKVYPKKELTKIKSYKGKSEEELFSEQISYSFEQFSLKDIKEMIPKRETSRLLKEHFYPTEYKLKPLGMEKQIKQIEVPSYTKAIKRTVSSEIKTTKEILGISGKDIIFPKVKQIGYIKAEFVKRKYVKKIPAEDIIKRRIEPLGKANIPEIRRKAIENIRKAKPFEFEWLKPIEEKGRQVLEPLKEIQKMKKAKPIISAEPTTRTKALLNIQETGMYTPVPVTEFGQSRFQDLSGFRTQKQYPLIEPEYEFYRGAKPIIETELFPKQKAEIKLMIGEEKGVKPISVTGLVLLPKVSVKPIVDVKQIVGQEQIVGLITEQITIGQSKFPKPPKVIEEIIPIPPIILSIPPSFKKKKKFPFLDIKGFIPSKFKGKYTPSVEAIIRNIKGKQPRGYRIGLDIRPILK